MRSSVALRVALLTLCSAVLCGQSAYADVEFDGSIGPNAAGTTRSGDFSIDESDGVVRGGNLFHSFERFSIQSDESAIFTASSPLSGIIARVTGNEVSTIAGALTVEPGLDFRLLNPMGILIAPGAAVDISGSAVFTTADSIRFDEPDGSVFFRVLDPDPLLSMSPPAAYGFREGASGLIEVRGGPVGSSFEFDFGRGAELDLVASEIEIERSTLAAESGVIRVVATGSAATEVPIDVAAWEPARGSEAGGDIRLSGISTLCVDTLNCQGGSGAFRDRGRIVVRGGRLELDDSQLVAGGDGSGRAAIDVVTSREISLFGQSSLMLVFGIGPNPVGGIRLESDQISLQNSIIGLSLEGSENDGGIDLTGRSILIRDLPIETAAIAGGDGPDLRITADTLIVDGGATVSTTTRFGAQGDGGSIFVEADTLIVDEGATVSTTTRSGSQGDGGSIFVEADELALSGGATLGTQTSSGAAGDAGSVFVSGGTIDLAGLSRIGSFTEGTGGAGRVVDGRRLGVRIDADDLTVRGGSQITTTTESEGAAGNIEIELSGGLLVEGSDSPAGVVLPSGLFSRSGVVNVDEGQPSNFGATGAGGLIDVEAESIEIRNGAEVSAVTFGEGDAGAIVLDSRGDLVIDGLGTSVNARGQLGRGGDIDLFGRDIFVSGGAEVAAEAVLSGDAGSISVDADRRLDVRGGTISTRLRQAGSNAAGGDLTLEAGEVILIRDGGRILSEGESVEKAGDIRLSTLGSVVIENGGLISAATSNLGNAGDIEIEGQVFELRRGSISTESELAAGGQVRIEAAAGVVLDDASVATSVLDSGDGSGGNIDLVGRRIIVNESAVLAQAIEGPGGNILIAGEGVLISADSAIDASSALNVDGTVVIRSPDTNSLERLASLPDAALDASTLLAERCATRREERSSSFVVGERDGTPSDPGQWLGAPPWDFANDQEEGRSLASARAALRGGDDRRAALLFEEMKASKEELPTGAWLAWADALQALGALRDAEKVRGLGRSRAGSRGEEVLEALFVVEVEYAVMRDHPTHSQLKRLSSAVEGLADLTSDHSPALARAKFRLGSSALLVGKRSAAIEAFTAAIVIADNVGADDVSIRARAMAARTAHEGESQEQGLRWLLEADALVDRRPTSRSGAEARIHLGETWRRLGGAAPQARDRAYQHFLAAQQSAEVSRGDRTAAAAWMGLSRLYEDEGRIDEALALVRIALRNADRANAPELLYSAEWQLGRILAAQGETEAGRRALEAAVGRLETLRFELPPPGRRHREDVTAAYYDLVDLLLREADAEEDATRSGRLLRTARSRVEASKASELRDYFRDACVDAFAAKGRTIDEVSEGAVVVHPIVLRDRMVLLVSVPGAPLRQISVNISRDALETEVATFRRALVDQRSRRYLKPAKRLYDLIVRPIEKQLEASGVETLVFVPDGSLRSIPMAALFDGDQFLIERFALAMTPSITLTDPRPLDVENLSALYAGISVERDGFPALPSVPGELASIAESIAGPVLLDEDFTLDAFESAVSGRTLDVLHLATHAEFGGSFDESFMLAHDQRLKLSRFEELVGSLRYRDRPLELLTLSACETAAGSDRAALGLSGIAVRAGARSVLGTLWVVNDEIASEVMVRFYEELVKGRVTRAEALRRAQRFVLDQPGQEHPFLWSPFVLVNNWL